MIRLPESDSLADLRLSAFDVIFRLGDRLVEHWNAIDPELLERARQNRLDVLAERSQRSGWRHADDPGYVLKEPASYKSILPFPALDSDVFKRLKGALASIGNQRDEWAHQTPALIGHPGPRGHLRDLTRDAIFAAETMEFTELVAPYRRLAAALEGDVVPEPATTASIVGPREKTFRIGAPTDVPFESRIAEVRDGRVWGDDARPIALPGGEKRTETELARLWSRIVGARSSKLWIAGDGRVIVQHLGRHWILDIVGENRLPLEIGGSLTGWVVEGRRPLLDTDASLWDYVTGRMYFEAGSDLGARLLDVWPDGGPLRITAEGAVGAQSDESGEAIYIGSISDAELDVLLS